MENEKLISLLLYDALNIIGASEKLRRRHQEKGIFYEMLETLSNFGMFSTYVFGGSCEGTTTPGLKSDHDILKCNELCPVIAQLKEAPKIGVAALLTLDNETPHGYVKLQVVRDGTIISKDSPDISLPFEMRYITLHKSGMYFWKGFDEDHPMVAYTSGPARTLKPPLKIPVDLVYSLRCRGWPAFANEWLSRKRNWPDKHTIGHLLYLGFFVVWVGHPQSKEKDFEWRVSFSLQERQLMFDLNDVQHKCYVMLKLINHDLIKPIIGESLTSYHCKTCLFYAIEHNSKSIWVPENLFQCIIKCLEILLIWTRSGHCPNYFIPKENMFDRNVTGKVRFKVIHILNELISEGASFLKRVKTDKLGDYFIHVDHPYEIKATKNYSENLSSRMNCKLQTDLIGHAMLIRLYLLEYIVQRNKSKDKLIFKTDSVTHAIYSHCELLDWLLSIEIITEHTVEESRDAVALLLPYFNTSLACHLVAFALKCSNVSIRDQNLCWACEEFIKGKGSDLTSGRLKYITYLYICGNYRLCEEELIALEQTFKPHVILPSQCRNLPADLNKYLTKILSVKEYRPNDISKQFAGACVIFLPTEIEIMPDALQLEMFRSVGTLPASKNEILDYWYDWGVVDSEVYMFFLRYLLSMRMNESAELRWLFLQKLTVSTFHSIEHMETAFNLVAWGLVQENLIPQAIMCMFDSWNALRRYKFNNHIGIQKLHQSHHNAVKWHMLLLLKQIWFSKNMNVSFCFKCFEIELNVVSLKTCSSCKIAKYCSKQCKKKDWHAHRKVCKLF